MTALVVLSAPVSAATDDVVVTWSRRDDVLVHGIQPVPGPTEALAARMCAAISQSAPIPPLLIVAAGSSGLLLPAVARAQHSAHRRVIGYLLIDPELPAASDTWPDAPVGVVSDDDWTTTQVRLRGWDLVPATERDAWLSTVLATA